MPPERLRTPTSSRGARIALVLLLVLALAPVASAFRPLVPLHRHAAQAEMLKIAPGGSGTLHLALPNPGWAPVAWILGAELLQIRLPQERATESPGELRLAFDPPVVRVLPGASGEATLTVWVPETALPQTQWLLHARASRADLPGVFVMSLFAVQAVAPGPRAGESPAEASVPRIPLAVAGVALTGTAAAAGAFIVGRDPWRLFATAPLAGLYSRLSKPRVLDHETRERILAIVTERPGIHYSALKSRTNLAAGVLVHHLRTLERHHYLTSRREGSHRCFYAIGSPVPAPAPGPLLTPMQERILSILSSGPRTRRAVAEALGITPQGASYHLKTLERRGLVATEYREGEWTYLVSADDAQRGGSVAGGEPAGNPRTP